MDCSHEERNVIGETETNVDIFRYFSGYNTNYIVGVVRDTCVDIHRSVIIIEVKSVERIFWKRQDNLKNYLRYIKNWIQF